MLNHPRCPSTLSILLFYAQTHRMSSPPFSDVDHRSGNSGASFLHPSFPEKCPAGFRTTDSVVGRGIPPPPNSHGGAELWRICFNLWNSLIPLTICVVWSRKCLLSVPISVAMALTHCQLNCSWLSRKTKCPESPFLCLLAVRSV